MEWRLEIFFPPKKGVLWEDSDWRESLTFKQALYPYRVGGDMHNPSKMHMNFPSSNSSRLNSSQWINYEYCMFWIAGDQIEFTVKKKTQNKNKSAILEYRIVRLSLNKRGFVWKDRSEQQIWTLFLLKYISVSTFSNHQEKISVKKKKKNSEATL